jgi:hypothetical protein
MDLDGQGDASTKMATVAGSPGGGTEERWRSFTTRSRGRWRV